MTVNLPVHSPLGASSSERWIECPGSVTLTKSVFVPEDEDPEYCRQGTRAHELGAFCLTQDRDAWEVLSEQGFEDITAETGDAIQVYLDYVRKHPGDRKVEWKIHRPEFHPMFYGTLDCIISNRLCTHIFDYKHGIGVAVEVKENPQLLYYAFGFLGVSGSEAIPDDMCVKLHIVQPRGFHHDGPIRTWETTAGYVREWAQDVLLPAMRRVDEEQFLSVGPWCRFCNAKLVCSAMTGLAKAHQGYAPEELRAQDDMRLGRFFQASRAIRQFLAAVEKETERRLLDGNAHPDLESVAKLVQKKADRVWKVGAKEALYASLGDQIYTTPEFRSPAQVEKLGVQGKNLVQEWAYKPEGTLTAAPIDDPRRGVTLLTAEQAFGGAIKELTTAS